jgi:two-component system alkaline phosphatase synthesis response regulator PhoP
MTGKKIAIVEDEADILEVIEYNLKREGYQVVSSRDGVAGLRLISKEAPNLVILDLMLPGMDGIEVCRKLKADALTATIPIIMVTAKGEEIDIVLGLGVGADDYVTKPFSPKELLARVRAVLRRGPRAEDSGVESRIVYGGLTIDATRHEARVGEEKMVLTATEFRLLHFLASHPGRVFTRDHLLTRAIADGATVIERNIDVHIRSVRRKLGEYRNLIETIRGVGYRFKDVES